jgi:hypothetical protein
MLAGLADSDVLTTAAHGNVATGNAGTFDFAAQEAARNSKTAMAGDIITGKSVKIANVTTNGTRTDCAAGNAVFGSGTFGDPGAPITPLSVLPAQADVRAGTQVGVQ